MPIRITGLGSGLDIESLVKQQMQAKRVPIDQKKQKLTYLSWQTDAYREMNTAASAFMNEARKLTLESTFLTKKTSLNTDDSQKVQVSANPNAISGNFTLQVKQLAKNASLASLSALGVSSNPSQSLADSDLTLTVAGELGSKGVSIKAGDNINQIISKINAESNNTGVKATYDQYSDKLTLISTKTGEAAKVELQVDGGNEDFLQNKLKLTSTATTIVSDIGEDAIVNFNGNGDTKVRSNSFTMNDISFTLLKDPDAGGNSEYTINVSVSSDVDKVVESIKSVFDKYNELIKTMNEKLDEPRYRDYAPLTDDQKADMKDKDVELWEEKAKSGLLRGDSVMTSGLEKMRRALSDTVSGLANGVFDSLADIGITTKVSDGSNTYAYSEDGKIYIDETKLRQALTDSPDQVATLFTKAGTKDASGRYGADAGIGTKLFDIVNKDLIEGLSQKTQKVPTQSYLIRQISDYTRQIADAEAGLSRYEQQLYSQYSKLESALNKLNSQSTYLSGFFSNGS